MPKRVHLLLLLAALGGPLPVPVASGADVPEDACRAHFAGRLLRWIVPGTPGGGYDTYSRLIEPFYERRLDTDVIVDNRTGAGGLVGMIAIRDARPDGGTLGLLDGPGLLIARLSGEERTPDPLRDYTLLGRIARGQYVWAVSGDSKLRSIDDAFAAAEREPLVLGMLDAGSAPFVAAVVTTALLGVDRRLVMGYGGSREATLAAIRGEVDLVVYNYDSLRDRVESGELRLLLQVSDAPIADDPLLEGVPLLGGAEGVAARRARQRGGDVAGAVADATTIAALAGAGRLVAAPLGLDPALSRCMEDALQETLVDPDFVDTAARARRAFDPARPAEVRAEIESAATRAERFLPVIRAAIREARE